MKIRPFRIKTLIGLSFGLAFFPNSRAAAAPDQPPALAAPEEAKPVPDLDSLLARLTELEEPVSREGAGYIIARAPGERYKLQFRLIARGPEAFRLEIFDLFGRPSLVLISYLGDTHLFSLSQQKEIPFNRTFSGPLAAISRMPVTEMAKIFWGRVPLFPYDDFQIKSEPEAGRESISLLLNGEIRQEFRITLNPFSLLKSLIRPPAKAEAIESTFSDFSSVSGNRLPLQCEVRQGQGDHVLVIRYETVIPRSDIPDDVFQFPQFRAPSPAENKTAP